MATTYTLITGANGEIGHSLLERLHADGHSIIAVDLQELSPAAQAFCAKTYHGTMGDITNPELYRELAQFDIGQIYHLAALLSTSAEKNPGLAQKVNVGGSLQLLDFARESGKRRNKAVVFLFPSTIAVYGFPTLAAKEAAGRVSEDEGLQPRTIYGINKLYCEQLGFYYDELFMRLAPTKESGWVDFRGVRFPGLISAFTVPTGGTSDYAPEMLHYAAQSKAYRCFVRPDARIPFMAMPDAVQALVQLSAADKTRLSRHIYNIAAFAPSAAEIHAKVLSLFPQAQVSFEPDINRQSVVDSWCADVKDEAARTDWDWKPEFDFDRCFDEYLAPNIKSYYSHRTTATV